MEVDVKIDIVYPQLISNLDAANIHVETIFISARKREKSFLFRCADRNFHILKWQHS